MLTEVDQSFAGLPIWRSEYRSAEPVGVDALTNLAKELYDGADPLAAPRGAGPYRVTRTTSGAVLHLALPFVTSAQVGLARNGDELVVTVGSYRRLLTLPGGPGSVAGGRSRGGRGRAAGSVPRGRDDCGAGEMT